MIKASRLTNDDIYLYNEGTHYRLYDKLGAHIQEVDGVSGACLLVSRQHAEAAGLLDERYFRYCEDVDFCAAVRSNGGRVYFTSVAEVVHLRGRSWSARRASRMVDTG